MNCSITELTADWLAGVAGWWLAGWLAGWLAAGGLLSGWLAGWLAGCMLAAWRLAEEQLKS